VGTGTQLVFMFSVCVWTTSQEGMIFFRKIQSEPSQELGSLSCLVINRPHFTSPPVFQRKVWPICLGHGPAAWTVQKYIFFTNWFLIPGLIALNGWRAQSAFIKMFDAQLEHPGVRVNLGVMMDTAQGAFQFHPKLPNQQTTAQMLVPV